MTGRCPAELLTVLAVVALTPVVAAAQSTNATERSRTPWGAPDLQGVWDYRTITPLQRSPEFAGQEFLSEEQAAEFERANSGTSLPTWSWWEDKLELTNDRRTALIVDPPDGRIPSLTPEAEARVAAMASVHRRPPEHPEARALFERGLVGRASGPPMIPSLLHYDSRVQVFQTPGYVVLFNEMIHETRVVPLDDGPHAPPAIRQWLGDSRGHWEGNTLVVETTNFTDQTNYGGWGFGNPYYRVPLVGANMHLVERFTRVDADTMAYEFTVDNPTTFSKPWSVAMPMRRTDDPLYEYACHEGNRGLPGILAATGFEEAAAEPETPGSPP